MDIVLVAAALNDEALTLRVELNGTPPTLDPVENEISYGFYLDVDADEEADFQVLVSNIERGGEFAASVTSVSADGFGEPAAVEVVRVDGDTVETQLASDAIGSPGSVRIAGFSEWTLYGDDGGFDQVTDQAPDVLWPTDGAVWVVLQ